MQAMIEFRGQLPMETRTHAGFLLSWPVTSIGVEKPQERAATVFIDNIASELWNAHVDHPTDVIRMQNTDRALNTAPHILRICTSELAPSAKIRKELLTRVTEIVANHHGLTTPALSFYSLRERERGSVPGERHTKLATIRT